MKSLSPLVLLLWSLPSQAQPLPSSHSQRTGQGTTMEQCMNRAPVALSEAGFSATRNNRTWTGAAPGRAATIICYEIALRTTQTTVFAAGPDAERLVSQMDARLWGADVPSGVDPARLLGDWTGYFTSNPNAVYYAKFAIRNGALIGITTTQPNNPSASLAESPATIAGNQISAFNITGTIALSEGAGRIYWSNASIWNRGASTAPPPPPPPPPVSVNLRGDWEYQCCGGERDLIQITAQNGASFSGTMPKATTLSGQLNGTVLRFTRTNGLWRQEWTGTLVNAGGTLQLQNGNWTGEFSGNNPTQWSATKVR